MILLKMRLESEEATEKALRKAADEFVRAGVTLSPSDWLLADPLERQAILQARERREIEGLMMLVTAFRNPSELVPMLGEAMGEEMRDRLMAAQGAETAAQLLLSGGAG